MMSRARFDAVYAGMTGVAKKVYAAVPLSECWPVAKIATEIVRQGRGVEYRLLVGCLQSLISSGLICEPHKGFFRREAIKEEVQKPPKKEENEMPPKTAPQPTKSPLEKLGELAQRVALMSTDLKRLASEIEDAAIDVQADMEANTESLNKLKQLQALLNSIRTE